MSAAFAARQELVLTTPYFVPDEAMLAALIAAARGVEVGPVFAAKVSCALLRAVLTGEYSPDPSWLAGLF